MKSRSRFASPMLPSRSVEDAPARTRHLARTPRASARTRRVPRPADTSLRMGLRLVAGLFFITFGYMKFFDCILLGTEAVTLPRGPAGFALYLEAVGVPFPLLNAYVVCLVEMLCGTGLILSAFLPAPALLTRLCALPLAGAMAVAVLTVGVRNLLGNPVLMNGIPVTAQPWRLPLEFGLLLITLLLLWRPLPSLRAGAEGTPAWPWHPGLARRSPR